MGWNVLSKSVKIAFPFLSEEDGTQSEMEGKLSVKIPLWDEM